MSANDLRDLYQEVILEHSRSPRNFKPLPQATCSVEGFNPLCGDHYTVHVRVADGKVAEAGFEGAGCAISKASASLMTGAVKGKSPEEAKRLFDAFRALVTGADAPPQAAPLGKLAAFAGVGEFPLRVKCATLAWHALVAALEGRQEPVSTE